MTKVKDKVSKSYFKIGWFEERMERICPFVNGKCIKDKCMFYAADRIDKEGKKFDSNRCIILIILSR